MDVRLCPWGRQSHCAKATRVGESLPRWLESSGMLQQPMAHSLLGCARTNLELPCWAGFYQAQIKDLRLLRELRGSSRQSKVLLRSQNALLVRGAANSLDEDNSSISGLALAEISKPNLKKHYHNSMFTGKRKNNQMKKHKISRERKFISKHLRECYKQ